jgi:hypothetical protein
MSHSLPSAGHLYANLEDHRSTLIGPKHWLGNLRWFAEEMNTLGAFTFRTCPMDRTEEEFRYVGEPDSQARRTLLGIDLSGLGSVRDCRYSADEIAIEMGSHRATITLPLERFGALIEWEASSGEPGGEILVQTAASAGRLPAVSKAFHMEQRADRLVWQDGAYTIVFRTNGNVRPQADGGFIVQPNEPGFVRLAVAFHASPEQAAKEADALFEHPEDVRAESRAQWEEYLSSCPIARIDRDFSCETPAGKVVHSPEEIVRRQYWHWHGLLANVYQLPFNRLTAYIDPDKPNWFGAWTNDGAECLRALARTNRHALARECLVEFVRCAITTDGDLSWFLHGTGDGCLGRAGDSARLSEGVPPIVTATWEYVAHTGDESILDAPAGPGGTVWEKLRRYMTVVFERRDINGDGLIEWINLWEGGADDKVGCFFSSASLEQWIEAVVRLPEAELKAFYAEHQRPVVNLYEQSFFLHALEAFEQLALRRDEPKVAQIARERIEHICRVLEDRHWDEADGFYFDWDVRAGCLARSKNQDAFYLARFLQRPERLERLFRHLEAPEEFGLLYTPTLAKSETGFRADGYWCGGHWPREMFYIGEALATAGRGEQAVELLVKAVCSAPGKLLRENLNPFTGEPNTLITTMAYNVLPAMRLASLFHAA